MLPGAGSRHRTVGRVYDHDLQEIEELGWEEFIARQWDSIFVGYRSWSGMRTMARRWSDLIEAGLGCSQEVADQLVQAEIINGPDRGRAGGHAHGPGRERAGSAGRGPPARPARQAAQLPPLLRPRRGRRRSVRYFGTGGRATGRRSMTAASRAGSRG